MFEKNISFSEEQLSDVKVYTKTGILIGDGELFISKNKFPSVSFDIFKDLRKFVKNTYFRCEATGKTYTLFDCEVLDGSIIPNLIVEGIKTNNHFKKVSVLFQGISEWMDRYGRFEGSEKEIVRKLKQEIFNVSIIDSDKVPFSIGCEHWWDSMNNGSSSHCINIKTLITIEIDKGFWSAKRIIEIIQDLKRIFTLLLGFPIGVEYVFDRTQTHSMQAIYFLNQTFDIAKKFRPDSFLVSSQYLFKQERWKTIFTYYFCKNSKEFQSIWSRVAGMFAYDGFWEYKILAYVSLVDKYVSSYSENKDETLSKGQFRSIRKEIEKAIQNYKSAIEKSSSQSKSIHNNICDSIEKQIQTLKNSKFSSFSEKFEFTIKEIDSNIIKIIDLSKDDFKHLKNIRDSIAHGDKPLTKDEINIGHEITLSSKLAVLLIYWAYKDFGFSDSDFITILKNWQNPLISRARLNQNALDAASNDYFFLKTNKTNFIKIRKKGYFCLVLEYVKKSDTYRVSEGYSVCLQKWFHNQEHKTKSVEEELIKLVDATKFKNIAYLGSAYAIQSEETFKIQSGLCILNCPDHIASHKNVIDRLNVFDNVNKKWNISEFEKRISKKQSKN